MQQEEISHIEQSSSGGNMLKYALPAALMAISSGYVSHEAILHAYNDNIQELRVPLEYNDTQFQHFRAFSENSGGYSSAYSSVNKEDAAMAFANQLLRNMHDTPEEFDKVFEENFWDLLA
ncbi:MAG: hypothetical protein R3D66_04665 [Alphaproteobacteria bacterium]